MRHFNIARKITSILANLSLLLNSFLPFVLAIQPVNAQSVEDLSPTPTPVEIVENSPTPTPEIVVAESPTPTPEVTPEVTPEITPEITPQVTPEITPEVTPIVEPTVTPENNQSPKPENNENQNNNSPEVTPEVTPTVLPTITPTPNPVVKEIEQVCLTDTDTIRNSVELDWNYDTTKDIYETREKVQLGVKYVFPQDNKVTVTFNCLPKDELLRSTLKIKRVKTSDLKLPNIENVSDYAYDITTDMRDGSFKYDITLPKLSDSTAKVSYIEKSLEEATLIPVAANEVKSIENLEQQTDLVKATDVDHFTIFITTGVWPTTSNNSIVSGEGTSQIRWPNGGGQKSGLGFVGSSNLNLESLTTNGTAFTLGTLTHYNYPVSSAIIWADLKITLGLSTPKDFIFRVQIDETENDGSCPYGGSGQNCNDKVTFPDSISDQIVTVGGIDYTLIIDGFQRTVGEATLDSFITEEYKDNTAVLVGHFVPVGRIIVDKVTNPVGDATSFSFTTTGVGYNSFSLTDSATPNNQVLPANRTYSVSESTVSGWTKINTNCISSIGDSESVNSLELDAGETITCTFTNAKNIASLRVIKNVVPVNDPGKFNLLINGSQYATNVGNNGETGYKTVSTGTVNFSETAGTNTNLSDYTVSYSTGCANGQTTLSIGETKTCTITNTRKAYCGDGIINGSETCDGSNLGSYSSTDFQCNSCSIELKESKVTICHSTSANNNPYIVNQPDKSGDVSGHASDNGPVWYPGITVQWGDIIPPFAYVGGTFPGLNWTTEGQAIYNNGCNLPNSTLKIVKIVDNTGGGIKAATDFKFSLNGAAYTNFGIGGSNTYTLKIGDTYSITESPEFSSSYSVSFNNCSGTIDSTQEVCTITNTYTPKCGDGIVNSGEQCDDANSVNTDSCTNSCKSATCGDGLIWAGNEICDDGAANDTTCSTTYGTVGSCSYCDATLCTIKTINNPVCGDGIVDSAFGEECDDANSVNTDSCTNTCKAATCGDGFIQFGEECDGSNLGGLPSSDYSCDGSCELNLVNPKVTICHADDSQKKPYVTNTPDKTADVGGHDNHNGGVWYPGIADHSWGDIIPPFYYVGGYYSGKNWTTEGQIIYNNGCQYPSGFINVVKVISNDATNYSDFSFSVNSESPVNFEDDGSNQIDAKVGVTYNIAEVPVSGYEVTYDGCKNISITKGETKTCTITNTKHAKLTVIKQVDTNNDGVIENQNATDWTWDIKNGEQNIATGQTKELVAGSYTISEDQKDAYRLKQWTCSNNTSGTTNSIGVTLNPGDDITCTITNTRKTGNIKVCKVVLDGNGNIVDGSVLSNNTFSISGLNQSTSQGTPAGVIGTTTFVTPLSYSEKLFGSEVDNAICTTYENLIPGNYYYGQESLPEEFWGIPKYNDGVVSQNNLNDHFYEYSGQLFDADPSNDGQRQTSSDGHIVLAADQTRTLIVVNQYQYAKLNVTKFNDFDGDGYQDRDEENLSDWTINLTGQTSAVTNSSGLVTFTDITPTNYTLSETLKDGWMQTNIICDREESIDNDNSHQITLTAGQTLNCKIGNRQLGKVTVTKFNDLNGNGQKDEGENNLPNWTINLTNQTSQNTNESGQVIFNNLVPGNYDLSENVQSENGWKQTNIYCEDSGNGVKITAPGEAYGHHGACSGWNSCGNAATCALWACESKGYTNLVSYGASKKCPEFGKCNLFYSRGSVQTDWGNGAGWCTNIMGVTDIVCSNGSGSGDYYNNGNVSGSRLTVNPGQNKVCYIGNQRPEPKTTITKSNNSGGVELSPGGSVEYKINLSFSDNSVDNLKVTDLLSNGFKYKAGSYKVYVNGEDKTSSVPEPEYHSPGVWNLADLGVLTPSDLVELVYIADISTNQQAGKYADLAWSIANYSYDSNKTVLALAGSEGHVDTNFVGTQVLVGGNYQNSVSAEVKQENHVTGQVLGASTELPGTGAATIWMIISGLLGLIGFSLLKFNKKTMLTILLTLLSFGLIISPVRAQTSNLSVRLEEPKTPSRIKEIELKYVALDIQGRGVTAYCLKKGPTDSGFVQFSSETLSGISGNASHCSLTSAITDNGSYQFQVKAVAGGEESLSNLVSLDYNTSSPGTPVDYRKEQINNCDFKIHFKTADDSGKTVKVELYRSTDSNFSANNESLVVSTDIGSNQEKDIWNNVPDCSKTYYYALRAFDSAGNGSGLVGDKVYTTITDGTTTITSTTTNSGAIPVSGTVIPKEGEGDQVNPDTSSEEGTGQVLGTRTVVKDFFSRHPVTTILIAILILGIIIYAFKKIRKGKKIVKKTK